jgi:hypothetical protein
MATSRKTVDDLYDQRYRSNAPESEALALGDIQIFEAARSAIGLLKKTFDTWITIGRAVVRARDIADRRGGGKTFMRLIEQQGLGRIVDKATASRLERIMERLPEVTAWHETLTEKQRIDWAAPTTIIKRCPVFATPKPDADQPKPLTPAEKDRQALAVALDENHKLRQQLTNREDGDRFKPSDSAKDIAAVLVGMFSPHKAEDIARSMLTLVKGHKSGKLSPQRAASE